MVVSVGLLGQGGIVRAPETRTCWRRRRLHWTRKVHEAAAVGTPEPSAAAADVESRGAISIVKFIVNIAPLG